MINEYSDQFYESVTNRAEYSSRIIFSLLKNALHPKTFVDVGSGDGVWSLSALEHFESINHVEAWDLLAEKTYLDIAKKRFPSKNIISKRIDFESSDYGVEMVYDLAVCLETFEHLSPSACEKLSLFFSSHTRILIFSGAVPGQGGTNHINEQPFKTWQRNLLDFGFFPLDFIRPNIQDKKNVPSYYKNNIVLWVNSKFLHELDFVNWKKILDLKFNPLNCSETLLLKMRYKMLSRFPAKLITRLALFFDFR